MNINLFILKVVLFMFRYWDDSFFPVDGSGFSAEQQQDCNGTYHNFG